MVSCSLNICVVFATSSQNCYQSKFRKVPEKKSVELNSCDNSKQFILLDITNGFGFVVVANCTLSQSFSSLAWPRDELTC